MARGRLRAGVCARPAFAGDVKPAPAKKADPLERVLATLDGELQLKEGASVNEIPLFELLAFLSKQSDQTFTINEEAFKREGLADIKEAKTTVAVTQLRGMSVRQFLALTLDSLNATYLVKNGVIEVVPLRHAAAVTKSATSEGEDGRPRLNEPLVSVILKEKPLNEAVATLAEMYDLNVIVSPQAGDAKTGFVSARLLNVPADKALELIAVQCDLRVVRKGNAFLLTSKDQANELFNEKLDKERQKIEVEKLREAPRSHPRPQRRGPGSRMVSWTP